VPSHISPRQQAAQADNDGCAISNQQGVWSNKVPEGSVTRVETRPNLSHLIPAEIAEIFGNPPVLGVENCQAYDQLLTHLVLDWKPRNITEWLFVRDLADISWEIFRHRRAIANTFAISFREALNEVVNTELDVPSLEDPGDAWFASPRQQKKVKAELMNYGLVPEAVAAQTYYMKGDVVDRLHRLLALAEARRTAVTRNFNEYRAMASLSEKSTGTRASECDV
jgi:hypothetical protein